MATGDRSFPFDDGNANEPEFRELFSNLGDGILDDTTGGSFAATVDTASQEVTVAPGRGRSAGAVLSAPNNEVLGLTSLGVQPTSGQARIDRVVLRTDYNANRVVRALLPGNPAGSSAAVAPELTQDPSGAHEAPLWKVRRTVSGSGVSITLEDERAWVGPTLHMKSGTALPDGAAIGTTVEYADGTRYHRALDNVGNPVWLSPRVEVFDTPKPGYPASKAIGAADSVEEVNWVDIPSRPYPRLLTVDAMVYADVNAGEWNAALTVGSAVIAQAVRYARLPAGESNVSLHHVQLVPAYATSMALTWLQRVAGTTITGTSVTSSADRRHSYIRAVAIPA